MKNFPLNKQAVLWKTLFRIKSWVIEIIYVFETSIKFLFTSKAFSGSLVEIEMHKKNLSWL